MIVGNKSSGTRTGIWIVLLLIFSTPALYGQSQPSYAELEGKAIEAEERGDLQTAVSVSKQMLDVADREFGRYSEEYRVVLYNLGSFYRDLFEYEKSLSYYERAAERYKKIHDQAPASTDNRRKYFRYEDCVIGMAKTYDAMGDAAKAEELYLKVLELSEERTFDPIYWQHLQATADFYIERDNFAAGLRYLDNNLDLIREHHTENSSRYTERAISVAYVYYNIGQLNKAKELFEQAKEYLEKSAYGGRTNAETNPSRYISTLQGLGLSSDSSQDYKTAIKYYDQNIAFIEQHFEKDSFYLTYPIINKATAYESLEKYDLQIELLNRALGILKSNVDDPNHNLYRNIYTSLGRAHGLKKEYERSLEYLEKAVDLAFTNFGNRSFEYAQSLYSLAVTYQNLDREEEAWESFLESVDINFNYLKSNFTTLTADERTTFWNSIRGDFENVQYQVIDSYKEKPSFVETGYNYLLKSKAFLLQNTTGFFHAVNRSNDPSVKSDFAEWQTLRSKISSSVNLSESEQLKRGIDIGELKQQARKLEQSIAEKVNFSASLTDDPVTWLDIQKELKEGEAAIEIIRSRQYSDEKKSFTDIHYAAYLLTHTGPPQLVELPDGKELENVHLSKYRSTIDDKEPYSEAYKAFWEPLEGELGGISTIYFSPDGVYHQVSLNTLKNPETGRYLLDNYNIRTVTKTSDIVTDKSVSSPKRGDYAVLFGRPEYATAQNKSGSTNAEFSSSTGTINRSGLSNAEWTDLPGTEEEVNKISSMLKQQGWSLDTYLHQSANESKVKELVSPRVLHIATHGFFTSQEGVTSGFTRGLKIKNEKSEEISSNEEDIFNPMMQSGLVFSGVQDFLGSPQSTQTEDGILTAFEASGLLLNDTELVVLSACETGLGEVHNGEGIYGLKRAFKIAGAESIIMSLWKVDDEATQEFMTRFYENWLKAGDKRSAFIQTQRQIRNKYQSPYYWGAFVMVGK